MSSEEVDLVAMWSRLELQKLILKAAASVMPSESQPCALALTQIGYLFLHPRLQCLMVDGYKVRAPRDIDKDEAISQFMLALAKLQPNDPAHGSLDTMIKTVSANGMMSLETVADVFSRLVQHVQLPAFRVKRVLGTLVEQKVLSDADVEEALEKTGQGKEYIRPDEIAEALKNELQSTAGGVVSTRRAQKEPQSKMMQVGQYWISEQAATTTTMPSSMFETLACGPSGVLSEPKIVKEPKALVPSAQSMPSPVHTASSLSGVLVGDESEGLDNPEIEKPAEEVVEESEEQKRITRFLQLQQGSKVGVLPLNDLLGMLDKVAAEGSVTLQKVDQARHELQRSSTPQSNPPSAVRIVPLPTVLDVFERVIGCAIPKPSSADDQMGRTDDKTA